MSARQVLRPAGAVLLLLLGGLWSSPSRAEKPQFYNLVLSAKSAEYVKARLDRYPEVALGVEAGAIPAPVRPMLVPLKRAADRIDRVYWAQASQEGLEIRKHLAQSSSKQAKALLSLLEIHYGPWDRHADHEPFIGATRRPEGGAYYPRDLSRRELETWVRAHYERASDLYSPYTVVVREESGDLKAVPYSKHYEEDLREAGLALREAAAAYQCTPPAGADAAKACPCADLARFLESRADSLRSDEYRESEMLWVAATSCPLDVVVGPYEYYEDQMMGLKTSFEAFITLRDDRQTERYQKLFAFNEGIFQNLPVSEPLRGRLERVKASPITIADVLYVAGSARAGYQVRAFSLPNDPVVQAAKGTKNVILKNVVRAKFDHLVRPVAEHIFDEETRKKLAFEAYLDVVMTWQLSHTVIPRPIVLSDGTKTTSRNLLRERSNMIEMIKGEALALMNTFFLRDKGVLESKDEEQIAVTYLASLFDSARLAALSPQALTKAVIYNYLAEKWVFRYNPRSQTFEVNPPAMEAAVRKLAAEALEIIARGDYDGAGRLLVQYGIMAPEMRAKLDELRDLPLDIRPNYSSL
jgi:hypothetical protein